MSVGFRKSFFGFNCDDVISYVQLTHKNHAEQEQQLNEEIDSLKGDIKDLEGKLEQIKKERDDIAARLKVFEDKRDEIERLSKNIGKLYLVANNNARAIMKNSQECSAAAADEVENNLNAVLEAQASLGDVKNELNELNLSFAEKIGSLTRELDEAKAQITEKLQANEELTEEFESVVNTIER